ncbi:hypothetical protein DVH24_032241 [Malus domestica]|uniref:Wound-responsive family protein n=1 Tax=Malus domestica TaxID=3750 RepID=A0A498J6L3_MALDO|nr:hypothetical protein DVH24_032241 [Malus domestica]
MRFLQQHAKNHFGHFLRPTSSLPHLLLWSQVLHKMRKISKEIKEIMSSSSASKAIVAASVGIVEALKDQGICRWNSALRYAGQQAKSQVRSFSQANSKLSSPSSSALSKVRDEKMKKSEESLRIVMS